MNDKQHSKFYETLEVTPDASLAEIRKAYIHLRKLYTTESIVTLPVIDEISEESKQEILIQIEEAYQGLLKYFEDKSPQTGNSFGQPSIEASLKSLTTDIQEYSGPVLKQIREKLHIDLHDIALETKIQSQFLNSIENETFDKLPPEAYIRGIVVGYATYLSLDSKKVADDFMSRYHTWQKQSEKKAGLSRSFRLTFKRKK